MKQIFILLATSVLRTHVVEHVVTSHAEISEKITEICCNVRRQLRDTVFKKLILYLKCFDVKFNLVINAHRNMVYFLFNLKGVSNFACPVHVQRDIIRRPDFFFLRVNM